MRFAIGLYLLITAAIVLVYYVAAPFLDGSINIGTVWEWLRPVRAVGIALMLVIHWMAMQEHPSSEIAGLSSRIAFFATAGLAVTFAGVWAVALNPDSQRFENVAYTAIAWSTVGVLYVTIAAGTGWNLVRHYNRM